MVFNQGRHRTIILSFTGIISFFLIILFFLIGSNLFAQNQDKNFQSIDTETYLLYTQQKWDSLIKTGNQAIKSGVDYFYLRQRIGIAYYNTENYLKAAQQFEKALKFNSSDATTKEYLYYCYIFSNQKKEAGILASTFNTVLKNKIQPHNNLLEKLYLETGPTFSNNINNNEIVRTNGNSNNNDPTKNRNWAQDLNGNKYYAHFGFELNISKRISTYLGYSFLSISKLKQINKSNILPPGNFYYYRLYSDDYNLYQNEFYGNVKIALGKGFLLTPAYHMLYVEYNTIYPVTSFMPSLAADVIATDTSFINQIVALSLNKNISVFNLGITTSWSDLNNKDQYQLGGIFTWFPKGNLNLYTTSSLVSAWQEEENRIVFDQLIGGKVAEKLWIEGYITLGEMVNFNEKNAFVVHNSGDVIKFRTGLNFIVLLSEKVELSFRYIYLQEEGYRVYNTTEGILNVSLLNYQNNTIIGGLKWTL